MGVALSMTLDQAAGKTGLERLLGRLEERSPLMARLAGYLEASTRQRWATQSGPGGHPWKPSIRARLTGGLTLKLSGQLLDSITSAHTDETAEVGTNKIYGPMMHFGGTVTAKAGPSLRFRIPGVGWRSPKSVEIPGRPFLGVDRDDEDQIGQIIFDYLAETAPTAEAAA